MTQRCARLKQEHGFRTVAMIGDGATDLEARPPADVFVGFGGIVSRPVVEQHADLFVKDFDALMDLLRDD